MKPNVPELQRPLSLGSFNDGSVYALPSLRFTQTNLFSRIAYDGSVVVKLPSDRGMSDYRKYIKNEESDPDDIRRNERNEKFTHLDSTLNSLPELRSIHEQCAADVAHYLVVHKLQHQRIKDSGLLAVPESRFVAFRQTVLWFISTWEPAIIQERVTGTALWDMYDFTADRLRPEWQTHKPTLSRQLTAIINSPLKDHLNWNIQNLIFQPANETLYYVDSKPSTMFAQSSNDHNLAGIRDVFI